MIVTAHAALRYLERVERIDVESQRHSFHMKHPDLAYVSDQTLLDWIERDAPLRVAARLLDLCQHAVDVGAWSMARDGVTYVFRNQTLVTVLRSGMRPWRKMNRTRRTPRRRRQA
jgi:hypothetical protein